MSEHDAFALVRQELERLRRDDLDSAAWWEWRRRAWLDGVRCAREVAAERLQAIEQAMVAAIDQGTDGQVAQ